MEQFHSFDIRNFAIVGHGAPGKISLAEAFLSANPCLLEPIINIKVKYLKSLWVI